MERLKVLNYLDGIVAQADNSVTRAVRHELEAAAHKLRYPMADILAKVPGDTLSERARRIGVSRQTMYVWANERFRPTPTQARIISDLTAVPITHITDDGFEVDHDTGPDGFGAGGKVGSAHRRWRAGEVDHDTGPKGSKKTVRMAELVERVQRSVGGIRRGKRRVVDAKGRSRSTRKMRNRPDE